jgi:hypothetical protein
MEQQHSPIAWKKMFDDYVVEETDGDQMVCVVDTFKNATPPQITQLRRIHASGVKWRQECEASKNDESYSSASSDDDSDFLPENPNPVKPEKFFSHQLCGSITPSLGDTTKMLYSLRLNADGCGDGIELKMVFGRYNAENRIIEYCPVSRCDALLWAQAFFSVEVDSRYAKIIVESCRKQSKRRYEMMKRKADKIMALAKGCNIPKWCFYYKHDYPEKTKEITFEPGAVRGDYIDDGKTCILSGFCDNGDGNFSMDWDT